MQREITEQYLPTGNFRPEKIGLTPDNKIVDKFHKVSAAFFALRLQHRIHYFFGQYQGESSSGKDNQKRAVYLRQEGVEPWRPIKSIAYTTPQEELVIAHLRQDRKVDVKKLALELGIDPEGLALANLEEFSLQYGTINPFIAEVEKVTAAGSSIRVEPHHIFDMDLVQGADYPRDDFVLTSSGDPRMYVEFDIRSYLRSYYGVDQPPTFLISQPGSEKRRIYRRSAIRILGGDNAKDPDELALKLKDRSRERLIEVGEYYGDRSDLAVISESIPFMARTIDTGEYGLLLQQQIAKKAAQHAGSNETWVVSSTAGDGVLGDTLRGVEGIHYRGRRETTEKFLKGLTDYDIKVAQVVLLGLSSNYDPKTSAFAGRILDRAVPVSNETQKTMEGLIKDAKTTLPDIARYFQLVEVILRRHLRDKFDDLVWGEPEEGREALRKPTVVVVNGATELAKMVEEWKKNRSKAPSLWAPVASADPEFIAKKFTEPYFETTLSQRRRLILFSPGEALIDRVIEENLGLDESYK
ncbi:hypothetical protein A2631_04615 [Candidatus Daviesbacteria bacterium RIFCSPHIGHO2_01_FULL_44_29]|uniref:Uncharacterized protein n=1 Tax=Candidatus Daviesbacteria bacterium RIFCSPHIGHO2_02_FULL_43_12 TaxID=1797776 RepID=A0A1F5KGC5_9BACT|nr:MAG: hypothetical protein A2631_04615 [Candidatus Daviesbacteria bacterium RIFCSPHIGHO2_01_FULL_44_29]OGE40003.1 MAG: hypothetical protein A3D25_04345 [Candidatus Daviesbacteria bacterium RIFCSPHIGHO2_02_FULL_43_12]OGE41513.1 MAG: hypothetical protein A3E86_05465 [Candidatus Daviesbacteria bacterium RIFCSPHIGHO2_12_FULL_47_45]OGE70316.1 MAG: hypothetical protein A3B55_01225 [Candidatus Daviesbacteria bacterium RIFCSPLOWO2_01_FULL_43_15]